VRVHGHSDVLDITLEQATVEWNVKSNLYAQLQGSCTLGRNMGFQPRPHANIAQFENTNTAGKTFEMGAVPASGRHQTAIRRTVNRILLIKWTLRRAGDGNRTRAISLGAVPSGPVTWPDLRGGVSADDRERPLVTGVNGPLMARRTAARPGLMAVP